MHRIINLTRSSKFRYLLVGGWNTIFGYFLMIGFYDGFKERVHILVLGAICNAISISMSFLTYKLFVFQTKGNWLVEWLKSFIVYGGAAIISTAILWLLVEFAGFNIYFAQAVTITIVAVFSYVGHSKYTFKKQKENQT